MYFANGFRASAEQLSADTGLPLTSIAPLEDAPPVAGLANAQLLFCLGGS